MATDTSKLSSFPLTGDPEIDNFDGPRCDKCGAPVTTGAMALICPLRTQCEFWPEGMSEDDPIAQLFRPSSEATGAKS